MRNSNAQALATLVACSLGGTAFGVEHGTLNITQLNTGNTPTSVSISQIPGGTSSVGTISGDPSGFTVVSGNKGDTDMQFTATRTNDRLLGVMLSSVAQNSRNNGLAPHAGGPAGISYGTSHSEPSANGYYIPAHATLGSVQSATSELNIDVAAAWFPHAEGWLAAHFKASTTLYSSPAIRLGDEFVSAGDGTSRVDLTALRSHGVAATSQNGVLLVTGGDNAANFALSRAHADGTFTVSLKNSNDLLGAGYTNGGVAFAYVPIAAAGMGQVKAVGKVQSDGGIPMKGGEFTVTKRGTGEWLLKIDGISRDDGTLILSPEGGLAPAGASPVPNNTNNFVTYEWSWEEEGWIVQSRNISSALEDGATADEPMFSFAFFTPGEDPVFGYENAILPTIALTSPANALPASVGQIVPLAADVQVPAGVTVEKVDFHVGGQLVGSVTTSPYQMDWTVDGPGFRLVEAFAHTTDGAVAAAGRVAVYAQAVVGAPAIPGYSVAIANGGDLESDVTELDPEYVPSATTPWSVLANTPAPQGFGSFGETRGAPEVNFNGSPVPFNSGILMGSNYAGDNYADATTRGAIDNNVIAYESGGHFALKVEDNKQGGGNPIVRPESGRFSLGYFPYADGWVGATVGTDLSIVAGSSNLPAGVTISKTSTSDYLIEGLPMDGNLLAVNQGAASDNVASIGRSANRWIVRSVDNNGSTEDDSFSFLYVPPTAPQVFSGLVIADGTLTPLNDNLAAIGASVVQGPNGYEIQFGDGSTINPSNTALFVTPDFNSGNGADNVYSYYASGNKFVVFSHDLPGISGGFQTGGFRFLAVPVAPATTTGSEVYVSVTVNEVEEGGSLVYRFSRLGGNTALPLTANYTVGGTATAGTDFTGLSGSVNFPANVTTVDVPVPTLADQEFELDETVVVALAEGTDYSPAGGVATATIRNVLYQPSVRSVSFQQGVNGYFGQFGKRVGSDGTNQLETAVQHYGVDGDSPDINGILRFDGLFGSGEGQIPAGASIVKAELVLTTAEVADAQSGGPWVVDRLLFPVDSTTNYIQMTQGAFAGVRGLSSRAPLAGYGGLAQGNAYAADVTPILRVWADAEDPNAANLGFSIYDETTSDAWSYCTSSNDDPAKRPKLVISYVMTGKQTQSYSFTADRSARLTGPDPTVDGATLTRDYIDQVTGATQEGLFHFPVTFGAGGIPLDEEIVRAELVLTSSSASDPDGDANARSTGPIAVHRMLEDWTPASNYGFTGPVVGTHIAIAENARAAGLGDASLATFDITGMVQAWREGHANHGLNVKPETGDGWQFFWPAASGTHANKVPKLVIYTAKESGVETSGFEQWATTSGIAGAAQDFDGSDRDGIPALVEYALGLSPTASDVLPGLTVEGTGTVLRFMKGSTDSRLVYEIESSGDLDEWTTETPTVDNATEISLAITPGAGGSRYYRLSVTYQDG